jgi:hypothetical protein
MKVKTPPETEVFEKVSKGIGENRLLMEESFTKEHSVSKRNFELGQLKI